jgi:lipopolysaccharide/colanic/teichoic acid biosynthesis glycosyltransferase
MGIDTELVQDNIGKETFDFIASHIELNESTLFLSTNSIFNFQQVKSGAFQNIVNIKRANNFKDLNEYFKVVNDKLPFEGKFFVTVETYRLRKKRILNKYVVPFNYLYYFFDFLLTRVSPKLKFTKNLYYYLSVGKGLVVSKTELLGRLYFNGFELIDYDSFDNKKCFVVQKVKVPTYTEIPDYGLVFKQVRIGYQGKKINFYKLRTMHPYAEYIQGYMFDKYGSANGDKVIDDYRVPTWGKFLRTFWIDEIPMLINFFKGEIKLVGVRPLSPHKFYSYPKDLQQKRILVKPGLIPPFYADMPDTQEAFYETEHKYLDAYLKAPLKTDLRYFFISVSNILFKKARSK